ncbi:MAG: hypothetical protein IKS96_04305 [Fibrobacter sp.]|nr:hypothetical protein [Fibrobacter sp.]
MPKKSTEPPFEEYINQDDPEKKKRAINWRAAIGLQAAAWIYFLNLAHATVKPTHRNFY